RAPAASPPAPPGAPAPAARAGTGAAQPAVAANAVPAPITEAAPRRDSSGWPWAASLSAHGQVESAPARSPSRSAPPPRTPTPAAELQPAAVVELARPTGPVGGKIGRTLERKKDRRQEIDDSLADVFERVQDLYSQPNEQASLYLL